MYPLLSIEQMSETNCQSIKTVQVAKRTLMFRQKPILAIHKAANGGRSDYLTRRSRSDVLSDQRYPAKKEDPEFHEEPWDYFKISNRLKIAEDLRP